MRKNLNGRLSKISIPVATIAAKIAETVTVEITKAATDNAPIYIAVTQAKKRAKKPPAAAKDTRRDMTMALTVAATKKIINKSNPVNVRRVTVPTCTILQDIKRSSADKTSKKIYTKVQNNNIKLQNLKI